MSRNDIFRALADPTRRAIFEKLALGAMNASALRTGMDISQPAVSQHLAVLRNAGLMAMAGIGVGLLTALMLSGSLSDLLFEVEAVAGATYGGVAVLLAGAVFLASYVPARRATKVDPMSALRGD